MNVFSGNHELRKLAVAAFVRMLIEWPSFDIASKQASFLRSWCLVKS